MSETLTLPVLPLNDEVVLPGMVVPIELSDQDVRGAIEAARNKGLGGGPASGQTTRHRCCWCRGSASAAWRPWARWPWSSSSAGCPAVSRARSFAACPGSGSARGPRGRERRCGSRAPSIEDTGRGARAAELAKEYKSLVISVLSHARRVAGRRHVPADRRPVRDRGPGRLRQLPDGRAEAHPAGDRGPGEAARAGHRLDPRPPRRARRRRNHPQGRHRGHGEAAAGVPAPAAACRGAQGAQRADRRRRQRGRRLPGPGRSG